VIFNDEFKVEVGFVSQLFTLRKVGEEWHPACMGPPPTKRLNVMLWGCLTYHGVGTLSFINGNITARKYEGILEENLWPVIAHHFPNHNCLFQDDNAPVHQAHTVIEYELNNEIWTILAAHESVRNSHLVGLQQGI